MLVTSLLLFRLIQESVITTNTHYQAVKKMYIYRVLMNSELHNMGLAPYDFDPEHR